MQATPTLPRIEIGQNDLGWSGGNTASPVEGRLSASGLDVSREKADECRQIAHEVAEGFAFAEVVPSSSFVGGGALPDRALDTWAVRLSNEDVEDVARRLRTGKPAVMARVQKNAVWLDVRTVARSQIVSLRGRLSELLSS